MPTFFRGIAVPRTSVDEVVSDIRSGGLRESGRSWLMRQQRPPDPDVLFGKPDLSLDDTRGEHVVEHPALCACGEIDGAAHYAWRHNRTDEDDTPILMEFAAPIEAVAVDGRDFLYTAFQLREPDRARVVLDRLFGPRVLRYAERAWDRKEKGYDIAMCDLAIHDPEVIAAHHANATVIGGRYRTVFRNAFTVRMPIPPEAIVSVWSPRDKPPRTVPEVTLDAIR
ncbi:hypothetical protein MKK65_26070 [Methylobacterium sp. J-001]|uniref:hypothetical protein n=1 Tax=Methylobacterium sp. J-001 TaxID=2836609 RepID=UPI001FBA19BA|nr:hypothetical protein [Methylobacterium sp. J-001]MCJ2119998.1 hypothetical protein [Methylobacterium sp. J-001]